MKKTAQLIMAICFVALFSVACNNSTKPAATTTEETAALYQCPMKCEGEKTYTEQAKCPSCGMDMEKVEAAETMPMDSNATEGHEDHEGHDHAH